MICIHAVNTYDTLDWVAWINGLYVNIMILILGLILILSRFTQSPGFWRSHWDIQECLVDWRAGTCSLSAQLSMLILILIFTMMSWLGWWAFSVRYMIILRLHFSAISFVYPRVLRWLTSLCQFLVISLIDDRTEILFLNDILDLSKSLILVDKLLPVFSDLIYLSSSS